MKKKRSKKSLKKKAWDWFSKYIRLKEADQFGFSKCVTCGARKHWKDLQAGHFVPGRGNSILFEETGVHAQCRRCNYNQGNGPKYFLFMEKTYGRKEIDRLVALRHVERKFSEDELIVMAASYKRKVETLLEDLA